MGLAALKDPKVLYWTDRRVDEMSHEELLEAFHELAEMHEELRREHARCNPMGRLSPLLTKRP